MTKRDERLQNVLVFLLHQSKGNYEMLSQLIAELRAVRETIRGLDPTFVEVLEKKRKAAARKLQSSEQSVLAVYDAMILEVQERWP